MKKMKPLIILFHSCFLLISWNLLAGDYEFRIYKKDVKKIIKEMEIKKDITGLEKILKGEYPYAQLEGSKK